MSLNPRPGEVYEAFNSRTGKTIRLTYKGWEGLKRLKKNPVNLIGLWQNPKNPKQNPVAAASDLKVTLPEKQPEPVDHTVLIGEVEESNDLDFLRSIADQKGVKLGNTKQLRLIKDKITTALSNG